eukprot:6017163-Amphidinium_carterae.3
MRDLGLDAVEVEALDCRPAKVGCKRYRQGQQRRAWRQPSTGQVAYLSLDCLELAHAVNCLPRHMQAPTQTNVADLKRVGWYLHSHKRLVNAELARQSDGSDY